MVLIQKNSFLRTTATVFLLVACCSNLAASNTEIDCNAELKQLLAENRALLAELNRRLVEEDSDRERALRPLEGLNPNREGGLNWNESIR